jgi:hypothetical protein
MAYIQAEARCSLILAGGELRQTPANASRTDGALRPASDVARNWMVTRFVDLDKGVGNVRV